MHNSWITKAMQRKSRTISVFRVGTLITRFVHPPWLAFFARGDRIINTWTHQKNWSKTRTTADCWWMNGLTKTGPQPAGGNSLKDCRHQITIVRSRTLFLKFKKQVSRLIIPESLVNTGISKGNRGLPGSLYSSLATHSVEFITASYCRQIMLISRTECQCLNQPKSTWKKNHKNF